MLNRFSETAALHVSYQRELHLNNRNYKPGLKGRLDQYLSNPLLNSQGDTSKHHQTVITCYSYHCPFSRKWQLIEWIMKRYKWSKSKAEGTPKAVLYAIWYNQR